MWRRSLHIIVIGLGLINWETLRLLAPVEGFVLSPRGLASPAPRDFLNAAALAPHPNGGAARKNSNNVHCVRRGERRLHASAFSLVPKRLPSSLPGQQFRVALVAGIVASVSQYGFYWCFKRSKRQSLSQHASYTAHSIVALLLMVLVSFIGAMAWWWKVPPQPLHYIMDPSGVARWLSAVICGSFLMWDIPTSIRVKELRNYDVIAHHVVMLILSVIGATVLPMQYSLYYFGVSELSSIPLVAYGQVKTWNSISDKSSSSSTGESDGEYESAADDHSTVLFPRLETILGVVTAISFTAVRAIHFPLVTIRNFLPDCWKLLPSTTGILSFIIPFLMVGSVGFTLLQLYWFSGLVQTVLGGNE